MAHRIAFLLLVVIALSFSCKRGPAGPVAPVRGGVDPAGGLDELEPGLRFRLRQVDAAPAGRRSGPRLAKAERISDAAAKTVLARLPALPKRPSDPPGLKRRGDSPPAPRTGATVLGSFPPDSSRAKPKVAKGRLKVLRFAPEGEVPLAPNVSVTFSRPMVAITSHDELAAKDVPVTLTPTPEGRWRWVGTKTLVFTPKTRMPMATEYKVSVKKGVRAADGSALGKSTVFAFATPAATLVSSYPAGRSTVRQPVIVLEFDQRVQPDEVAKHVSLKAGRKSYEARLATKAEIAKDEDVTRAFDAAVKGRVVALRPKAPLPGDTQFIVELGPGLPSAEGPRTTAKPESFGFRTYGPLKVEKHECGWRGECPPGTPFRIDFSNALDAERFDPEAIEIEPTLPTPNVEVYGASLYITGRGKGRTTYAVTLPATLTDEFGQRLGKAQTLKFRVTKAPEQLWTVGGPLISLEPAAKTQLKVFTVNYRRLKVQVFAVKPSQWEAFTKYVASGAPAKETPPGRRVFDDFVKVENERDEIVETNIDLKAAAKGGKGHAVVIVEGVKLLERHPQRFATWVQATALGLDAFVDATDAVAWVTDLKDGKPVGGVQVELVPSGATTKTDGDGVARLPLTSNKRGDAVVLARRGNDVSFLPERTWWWEGAQGWRKTVPHDALAWFVLDDRTLYQPGETVHFKGWLRRRGLAKGGDLGAASKVASIGYKLVGSRGNEVLKGSLKVSRAGAFSGTLELPKNMNLGAARIVLEAKGWPKTSPGQIHHHRLSVQEFRRPEFEVAVSATEGPHVVGGSAVLSASAQYYAGGGLQGAEAKWNVTATETQFTPPNQSSFMFGRAVPWWMWWTRTPTRTARTEQLAGRTDGGGKHHVAIEFVGAEPPVPHSVAAEAAVTDVNRQRWAGSQSFIVHPATAYVGVKLDRRFVEAGESLEVDTIVADLDGKALSGREVVVTAARLSWETRLGNTTEKEHDVQRCRVKSGAAAVRCSLPTKAGGTYRVRAVVTDEKGRNNLSETLVWVIGGEIPVNENVTQERVTLIPDRDEYKVGDVAKVLVVAPFSGGHGAVTIRRSGLEQVRVVAVEGNSHALEVPIKAGMAPNVHVQVDLVGAALRRGADGKPDKTLPKRPAYASGSESLKVPPVDRKLSVEPKPSAAKVAPGAKTKVAVTVTDHAGKPVRGADVALIVVDESVLDLAGWTLRDPVDGFYPGRPAGVRDYHSRAWVAVAKPGDLGVGSGRGGGGNMGGAVARFANKDATTVAGVPPPAPPQTEAEPRPEAKSAPKKKGKKGGRDAGPIALRSNFDALALFEASVPTDAKGRAQVDVKMPDNLTRYRVIAVASAGERQFGSGESTLTARLPLMVRPSAPRFLNFGDAFELPIVVHNQTESAMSVKLAVRAGGVELTAGAGRRVAVAAGDRLEVRFPARTAEVGTAHFQVAGAAGSIADAAQFELPIWTPATTEAFATYGEIDKGVVVQPVERPPGVFDEFGGLEITTTSTAVSALTDAVLYLVRYPFECNEQIASRVLAIASLRDVLAAFEAEGLPPSKELLASVDRDLKALARKQRSDGGFGFWRLDSGPWPYLGVHVAHAVTRAAAKGFKPPKTLVDRSTKYLRNIEKHIPGWYGPGARRAITAYALYVRHLRGDSDPRKAKTLVAGRPLDKTRLEVLGWLLPTLKAGKASDEVSRIRTHLDRRVTETAATAHFADGYGDGDHLVLYSNRRADGILLEALIDVDPKNDLIAKVVRGLLAHRKAGRWSSTQENAFVLLALDRYFGKYEKATPNFVARAWLGDRYAGDHKFKGRTTERHRIEIPMARLGEVGKAQDLLLQKQGPGRLYYRIGMRYAPDDLALKPFDEGFAIERAYEAVDDPKDVRRDKSGTWRIKAGARVRVRVTMAVQSRRYHVALVDPLPAGLEPQNPELAATPSIPTDPKDQAGMGRFWWWKSTWYEHQNMRDERVEAFASLLWEGVHEYVYVAIASTPGNFVVPPAKAEEMYHPEVFGRSGTDRVVVE